jgi:hypothetical protein
MSIQPRIASSARGLSALGQRDTVAGRHAAKAAKQCSDAVCPRRYSASHECAPDPGAGRADVRAHGCPGCQYCSAAALREIHRVILDDGAHFQGSRHGAGKERRWGGDAEDLRQQQGAHFQREDGCGSEGGRRGPTAYEKRNACSTGGRGLRGEQGDTRMARRRTLARRLQVVCPGRPTPRGRFRRQFHHMYAQHFVCQASRLADDPSARRHARNSVHRGSSTSCTIQAGNIFAE